LQSMNEEMRTAKEEMQSMNDELQSINKTLQLKVNELTRSSNDMKNLVNCADIACLFLDEELHVRRFTPQATNIMKILPNDMGRPIGDFTNYLNYPTLAVDAHEVLHTLVSTKKEISASKDRWFMVCIMPYRTHENRIDGVVVTFLDISKTKKLELELEHVRSKSNKSVSAERIKI
jgi:two-component system CheB/CheR fusion protein